MVFRGKPSGGCSRCRSRRLKCDQKTPSCSQCIRADQKCTGYRDLTALMFENQSDDVIRKAKRIHIKAALSRQKLYESEQRYRRLQQSPQSQQLTTPIDDEAACFVYGNYILDGKSANHYSFIEQLLPSNGDSAIRSAMKAVGLAALANIKTAPNLMRAAREEYTTALAHTNQALRDQSLSKEDSTLGAVILLGMFEIMTCNGSGSMQRWRNHVEGAGKLIEWRGEEQLRNLRGLSMFRHLKISIITNNIYTGKPTSSFLTHLCQVASEIETSETRFIDKFSNIAVRFSNFCAAVKNGELTEPWSILEAALSVDNDLIRWSSTLPSFFSYRTVPVDRDLDTQVQVQARVVYGDHYHIYNNLSAAMVLNNYRALRMVVHEYISGYAGEIQQLKHQFLGAAMLPTNEYSKLKSQSDEIAKHLVAGICASVPYHLGAVGNAVQNNTHIDPRNSPHGALGGYALIWPLYLAADRAISPPSLKRWAIMYMDRIGYSMGINQALAMSVLLNRGLPSRTLLDTEMEIPLGPDMPSEESSD
ncbi:hypothetical protein BGW36DRAFT_462884 [Talaromyces proteolyticus]|uniref:Zn(2)-C6 fungal-type domain-containing protein n=1 Tax=Talaromyces proteolyticus TaxID=1131652 RepID=A0AAD4KMX6_9EURO|nr:uncharacterized protein BGW36DRAFT_462884 [Talaromyces proteolyticus]KAH8695272.1 hypothetical protein BGW36DRAFT_462884 [Talaromyces proteolyticus]